MQKIELYLTHFEVIKMIRYSPEASLGTIMVPRIIAPFANEAIF